LPNGTRLRKTNPMAWIILAQPALSSPTRIPQTLPRQGRFAR
jgi:hypothetical protein